MNIKTMAVTGILALGFIYTSIGFASDAPKDIILRCSNGIHATMHNGSSETFLVFEGLYKLDLKKTDTPDSDTYIFSFWKQHIWSECHDDYKDGDCKILRKSARSMDTL